MRFFGFRSTFAFVAVLACVAALRLVAGYPATAQQVTPAPERPLVFVPGLLGSALCRTGPEGEQGVVFGTLESIGEVRALVVEPAHNEIAPCGLIREVSFLGVFTQSVYGPFIERLEKAGYREGETLFVFDYDWRLSVFDNAQQLAAYIEDNLPGAGPFDIVGHSMGGLVAKTYALEEGGAPRIGRLVTAGTPWLGSVQVFQLLKEGMGLANVLIGGVEEFRRIMISFPSTFELMPSYDGCCGGEGRTAFDAGSADAWAGLNWAGIEAGALPDLGEVAGRQARLQAIVAAPLPDHVEEGFVVGVDQRTPEHYVLETGSGEARLSVGTSWEGDGTVMRSSAALTARVAYPTSFATHDAILNDPAVQDFVIAALAEGPRVAVATVPVRERTTILTALGELVQLIGVAIETDQPMYQAGSTAKVSVHVRLPVDDPIDAQGIRATVTLPGGAPTEVALAPDPAASDPSVPLEQSFSGLVETGAEAGQLIVTVTLEDTGGEPRTVTRVVPVVRS